MNPEFGPLPEVEVQTIDSTDKLPKPTIGFRTIVGRALATLILVAGGSYEASNILDDSVSHHEKALLIESGSGSYDNGLIADTAKKYIGRDGGDACNDSKHISGDYGGECRAFVNCIISIVSGGSQNIGKSKDYFSALREYGQEITDINSLSKGDIVQEGNGSGFLHTFIIVNRRQGNSFNVVDSNFISHHKVGEHPYTVNLSSNERAFRMGRVAPPPAPILNPNRFDHHIVQWDNGPGKQHTSWLVWDGNKRYWIPDIRTFNCLRNQGYPDDGVQPASVLDTLPDQVGRVATCQDQHKDSIPVPVAPALTPETIYRPFPTRGTLPSYELSNTQPTSTTQPDTTTTTPAKRPTYREQEGRYGADTFSNYHNASGYGPRKISPYEWVEVECKVYDPYIQSANPDGYWYRIASSPWNSQYYAVANTFYNGDPQEGPYTHNTDSNVPDC